MTHQFRGILALLLVTLVWGTTFPAMKDLTVYFSPVWIIFLRFALAAVLLAPFLYKAGRDDLVSGGLLGVLLFFCYVFQVEGLALTTSNRNAFICGLNVLVVPLLGVVAGKMPEKRIAYALLLAIAGLTALCWDGGAWGRGDTLALVGAFAFGVYIKMMEFRTRRASRLMTLTAAQIVTVALCAALWLLAREVPRSTIDAGNDFANYWTYIAQGIGQHGINLAYLGVVATAAIISLQGWGQARSTANEAAVIYAFEPAAAAFFAFFWLGETLTARGWMGAVLLIAGMIVSQWNAAPRPAASLAPE
ncbi:multidrug DMT transporter permease [Massilia eurypsychrophila]|jgi:drug/metabolite transporter (DMT)-like permease|uniref:Multidrug DMT transporter permease n=1 Tax=Massilia eurypsychrophila TaxID=1485217 RepID=A0A2G8TKK4_9BURK|nr:DMT family transporter [Massilia eurypsychrophila]PIL46499.1 multidrug DMT transporter permease [Massilia eurypsychrophila]